MSDQNTILEMVHISKRFPGVKALDDVYLRLDEGKVLGLVGENGAGKSTLIKIITGVYKPDAGDIFFRGEEVRFNSTKEAFEMGISAVHQERNIIGTFSVAENIFFNQITRRPTTIVKMKEYYGAAEKYLNLVGLDVSPRTNVEELKSGQQQLLEIARALSSQAKVIMLDEPTASISVKEVDVLLGVVENLKQQGYSFVYVSHKLEEIFTIADDVCVIRDGKNAGDILPIGEFDRDKLITQMVGRAESKIVFPVRSRKDQPVIMSAENTTSRETRTPVSFGLHHGEILGWYGLVGAGRTEVARSLIGADPVRNGELWADGEQVKIKNTNEALHRFGIAYASENRNLEGLFLSHSVKKNISASVWRKFCNKLGIVDKRKEEQVAEEFRERMEIRTPSIEQHVVNLSGGNRQKVSIAKCLAIKPQILILDEPTVGIDIKTKEEIHELIWELAENGMSVIVISSDMPEIIKIADRILVFNEGSICGEIANTREYATVSKSIMQAIAQKNNGSEGGMQAKE